MRKRIIGIALVAGLALVVGFVVWARRPSRQAKSAVFGSAADSPASGASGSPSADEIVTPATRSSAGGPAIASSSGVPGARAGFTDTQEFDLLWKDLRVLEQRAKGFGPDAYKARFLARTVAFLQLDDPGAKRFTRAVDLALQDLDDARARAAKEAAEEPYDPDKTETVTSARASWTDYQKAQRASIARILALLDARPRHQMFKNDCLKWALQLDYGTRGGS
jgi:hypothetical protein